MMMMIMIIFNFYMMISQRCSFLWYNIKFRRHNKLTLAFWSKSVIKWGNFVHKVDNLEIIINFPRYGMDNRRSLEKASEKGWLSFGSSTGEETPKQTEADAGTRKQKTARGNVGWPWPEALSKRHEILSAGDIIRERTNRNVLPPKRRRI